MNVKQEILKLITEEKEWRHFFQLSCEYGHRRLTSQAWQWRDELRDRGQRFDETEISDTLLDLAAELLPDSPAGSLEVAVEARDELECTARRWFEGRGLEPDDHLEGLDMAYRGDLAPFRKFLRERMREALAEVVA